MADTLMIVISRLAFAINKKENVDIIFVFSPREQTIIL